MKFVKLSNLDEVALYHYFQEIDNDFEIPLSQKVDIHLYAARLLKNGYVLAVVENENILSLIGFYCNDFKQKKGYVSILSTKKEQRGKGYAKTLVREMIKVCQQEGMSNVYVDTVNPQAATLYKSIGFVELYREKINGLEKIIFKYNIV